MSKRPSRRWSNAADGEDAEDADEDGQGKEKEGEVWGGGQIFIPGEGRKWCLFSQASTGSRQWDEERRDGIAANLVRRRANGGSGSGEL